MSIEAKARMREQQLAEQGSFQHYEQQRLARLAMQREQRFANLAFELGQVRAAYAVASRERRELTNYLTAAVVGMAGLSAWVTWLLLNGAPCLPASS